MKTALLAALIPLAFSAQGTVHANASTRQTDEKVAELDQILHINP
jgi:hypothetical protein